MITAREFYEGAYQADYGDISEKRISSLRSLVKDALRDSDSVLEVGCGLGWLSDVHPNWTGVEYSASAVKRAKGNVVWGDATNLNFPDKSFDLVYSFATLEHVPAIERALLEIERVSRKAMLLWPAWNCRPWTVKKLQVRPYHELGFSERLEKALIPLRESIVWRSLGALPRRLWREAFRGLDYKRLSPDFTLPYPHVSDDDAFVSIDAHAVIVYFVRRGWKCTSHPTFWKRMTCRGEPVMLIRK